VGIRALAVAVLVQLAADARSGRLKRHPVDWEECYAWAEVAGVGVGDLRQRVQALSAAHLTPAHARTLAAWGPRRLRRKRPPWFRARGDAVAMAGVVSIRVSPEALQRLQERAKAEGRPLSTYVKHMVEQHCAPADPPGPPAEPPADPATDPKAASPAADDHTVLPTPPSQQPKRKRRPGVLF
jgi:hypothetical protein